MIKEKTNSINAGQIDDLESNSPQVMVMGSALVGLNLFLMVSVGLYWTNPYIHEYFSGKPL